MRTVKGFSLIELLVVIAIILIIMGMAIPRLTKGKTLALETGAIKAITTIHTAQAQYQSQFGKFAPALLYLGPPASGLPTAAAADLISADLASGERSGYKYNLQPTEAGYTISCPPDHLQHERNTLVLFGRLAGPATEFHARPGHSRKSRGSSQIKLAARSASRIRHTILWRSSCAES